MIIEALKLVHCQRCGRFLGKEDLKLGTIEIPCPKCKATTILTATPKKLDKNLKSEKIEGKG